MSKQEHRELELTEAKVYGFFDIDDTLTKGNTTICFAKFLHDRNFSGGGAWGKIKEVLDRYQASDRGDGEYLLFANGVLGNLAAGLRGVKVEDVVKCADDFFQGAIENKIEDYRVLAFSQELVKKVRLVGTAVAVSGSSEEILYPFGGYFGFDVLEATIFEKDKGVFTGRVARNLAIDTEKQKIVADYVGGGIDREHSFAFGDSTHDIPLLEAVGNRFVLGNNPILRKIGLENGWHVHLDGEGVLDIVNEINS